MEILLIAFSVVGGLAALIFVGASVLERLDPKTPPQTRREILQAETTNKLAELHDRQKMLEETEEDRLLLKKTRIQVDQAKAKAEVELVEKKKEKLLEQMESGELNTKLPLDKPALEVVSQPVFPISCYLCGRPVNHTSGLCNSGHQNTYE